LVRRKRQLKRVFRRIKRVANVPAAQFDAAIEGDKPATVTALAEMGTVKKPLVERGLN
jgi:hypothetical protein